MLGQAVWQWLQLQLSALRLLPPSRGQHADDKLIAQLVKIRLEVEVHNYLEHGSKRAQVQESFQLFRLAARLCFSGMPETARLMYFVGEGTPSLKDRENIVDDATYLGFLKLLQAGAKRVTLFIHPAATSPTKDPVWLSDAAAPAAAAADSASQAGKSLGKGSARSSAVQEEFVNSVRIRDEAAGLPRQCAACGSAPELLEAAHIVSRKTDIFTAMTEFGLGGINIAQNGMQLCDHCHYWFDKHLWWVQVTDGVETIVVADALLADEATRTMEDRHFTRLHGSPMRLPRLADRSAAKWPVEVTWLAQQRACVQAREARHAEREGRPEQCERCHKPYSSRAIAYLRKHEPECVATIRQKHLITPAGYKRRLDAVYDDEIVAGGDADAAGAAAGGR